MIQENDPLTERIIAAMYAVSNELGIGFLEKVYENALAFELKSRNLIAEQQKPIKVFYRNALVGEYFADILVEEKILVELKVAKALDDSHVAQCLNYLRASRLKTCLLVNFGKSRVEVRRLSN
jgi:GxxExxY protein